VCRQSENIGFKILLDGTWGGYYMQMSAYNLLNPYEKPLQALIFYITIQKFGSS